MDLHLKPASCLIWATANIPTPRKMPAMRGSVTLSMDITDGQTRYIYYRAANCDSLKVSRNDSVKTYSDTRGHLVELGNDGHIELEFVTDSDHSTGTIELYMFTYDTQVFEKLL